MNNEYWPRDCVWVSPFSFIHIPSYFKFAVWKITIEGDSMVLSEQSGSHCCLFVPNPFLKTHRFQNRLFWLLNRCSISGHFSLQYYLQNDERRWEHLGRHLGVQKSLCEEGDTCVNVVQALRRKNVALLKQILMFLTKRIVTAPQVFKLISLQWETKVGEDELRHWTTDGWFTLTRFWESNKEMQI